MDQEIAAALDRVLVSRGFANSPRLSRFLRYLVEQSQAGDTTGLKESVIAMEVYDRGTDYDPTTDSTVRAEASRLRRHLAEYYQGPGGADPVRIEIPRGGYAPVFLRPPGSTAAVTEPAAPASSPVAEPPVAAVPPMDTAPVSRRAALGLLAAASGVGAAVWTWRRWTAGSPAGGPQPEAMRMFLQASDALAAEYARRTPQEGITRDLADALRLFGLATGSAPRYPAAWAGLARARYRAARCERSRFDHWIALCRAAATEATRLDPQHALGVTMLARLNYYVDFDFQNALRLYETGVPLDPNDAEAAEEYIDLLGQFDRVEEARQIVGRELGKAPQLYHWRFQQAKVLMWLDRFEEAGQIADSGLADARQAAWANGLKGRCEWKRDPELALRYLKRARELDPFHRGTLALLGLLATRQHRQADIEDVTRGLQERLRIGWSAEMSLAETYELAGNHGEAVRWLTEAVRYRDPVAVYVSIHDMGETWIHQAARRGELGSLLAEFPQWSKLLYFKG